MPSTVVHVGVAALIGTALLAKHFDARAIFIVMAVAAFPDIDTFIGLWVMDGGHRTVLHNLVFAAIALAVIWWDTRWRSTSAIRERAGDYGVRVAWVSIVAGWLVAHVLLDAFHNGVNLFWPVYDQFIDLSGQLYISDQEGLVQTFITLELSDTGVQIAEEHRRGSADERHYRTGVDLGPNAPDDAERKFPIGDTGELFLLSLTGYLVAAFRIWDTGSADPRE